MQTLQAKDEPIKVYIWSFYMEHTGILGPQQGNKC